MVTDELSFGPERSGRRWVIAIVACLSLLAAVALFHQIGDHAKTKPTAQGPTATVPTGSYEITRSPSASQPQRGAASASARLDGVPTQVPRGIRLLLGGQHPTEIGGNPRQFAQVPVHGNQAVVGIVPVQDGFVVEVEGEGVAQGTPAQTAYWVRPDGEASLIAKTDVVIPSQAGDRIFAYRRGPGEEAPLAKRIGHLVEVTLAGRVVASHPLPAGLLPLADTPEGLLFSDLDRDKVEIRDRRTLSVRKDVAKPEAYVVADRGWLATSGDPFCTIRCLLTVQNIATAKKYQLATADNRYIGQVAVNPSGHGVAISYWSARAPGFVVVADLATGSQEQIPGVSTESLLMADLAWTPDGRTLAISVGWSRENVRRIALWPGNGGPLEVLPGTQPWAGWTWSLSAF